MSDIVFDSCVVAKVILPEQDSTQAHQLFNAAADAQERVIALDLAPIEVTNAIWKRFRAGAMTAQQAVEGLGRIGQLPIEIKQSWPLLDRALEIAMKYDRSIYDALFVALARNLRLRGVTSDEPLYNVVHPDFPEIVLLRDT